MLKKINEGGVESSNGFSIQITGPELLVYKYNDKTIEIDMSLDRKMRKISIYASQINDISSKEKKEMMNHIAEAVQLLKGTFEIL